MADQPVTELRQHRIKRLHMRSMRRGIKEMDLILTAFARNYLEQMDDNELNNYDALLNENDQQLYAWINGSEPLPPQPPAMLERVINYVNTQRGEIISN